jgi:vacuolar-type H+-ATPase subunit D/Vma8
MNMETPRTDKAVKESNGQWSYVLADTCKQLERELAAKTEAFDRLNESLPKTKRLFTNALSQTIIDNQHKRIKQLEDELILAKKENP